jgi:NAD(P)-dependent dehydrogenase (short-subunit alcohol dehydrogenase family)
MKLPEEFMFLKNVKAPQHKSSEQMDGKLCVISGATSGVGLAALRSLLKGGAKCVIVSRNVQKAERIKSETDSEFGADTDIVIADFASFQSVRTAASEIISKYPIIDVLINSAGLHSTRRILTQDGNEMVFQVNHLSSLLFTKLLLENLKKSAQGRIIQVNSQGHRFGGLNINDLTWKRRPYIGLRGYGASKIAQLICVMEMAKELDGTGVTINAMHPGAVKSAIGSNNGKLYTFYNKHIVQPGLADPKVSGDALYWLASDKSLTDVSGKFFDLTILEAPAKYVLERDYYDKVYPLSLKLCGLD